MLLCVVSVSVMQVVSGGIKAQAGSLSVSLSVQGIVFFCLSAGCSDSNAEDLSSVTFLQ